MMHSILATLLICLGMSNSGMPISNYIEENQELKLSQTDLQPKLESTTTTNTITLNNQEYTASPSNYYYQTWQSRASFGNNAFTIIANQITTSTSLITDNTGYGYLRLGQYNQTTQQIAFVEDDHCTKYDNNNTLLMLEITPYNINVETKINLKLNCTFNVGQANRLLVETYTTTDNVSQYFNSQITARKNYNIMSELYNINNGYMYNTTSKIEQLIGFNNTTYANVEQEITITPNITNYVFLSMYTLQITQYTPIGADVYTNLAENKITLENNQFSITNTNIIPSGTYEVVDIPGVMFYILTMPFTFVSQAFNLTLFVGTPYQINISNLFLAILAMLIFIWIIKLIVQKGG